MHEALFDPATARVHEGMEIAAAGPDGIAIYSERGGQGIGAGDPVT